jgi:hypothetical protein
MKLDKTCIGSACLLLGSAVLQAPAQAPDQDNSVSREEHDALRRDFETLKDEMEAMKRQRAAPRPQGEQSEAGPTWMDLERAQLRIDALEAAMEETESGLSSFHVTGYGFTRYVDRENEDSTFSAVLAPLFLWQVSDRLLFEAEIELELESEHGHGDTELELEYADASYILNDYVTLGAGKFLTPFGLFPERLHPAWINKLPDGPLIYAHGTGIAPFSSLGIFARGGFPVGPTKMNYAVYLSNGPALNTGEDEPEEAGILEFENWEDINNNKAVGGRVGFLPIPAVEVGYSFLWGRVNPSGEEIGDTDAFIWGFDVTYVQEVDVLAGLIDARFEFVRSEVDTVTYDADGMLGFGPLRFDNDRDGLYAQLAYRPTKCGVKFVRDFEFVGRYDYLNAPSGSPEPADTERWTIGVNYWVNPSTVVKLAYQRTDVEEEPDVDAFLAMFAVGF